MAEDVVDPGAIVRALKVRVLHDLEEWKEVDMKPKQAGRPSNMA